MSKPASTIGWIPGNETEFIEDPGSTKTEGWIDKTPAPNLQFNWFWNLTSQWINYLDEITQASNDGLNVIQDGTILFNGSSYDAELLLNTVGDNFSILPKTDNVTDLEIGTASLSWKDIKILAENDINLTAGGTITMIGSTGAVNIESNANMEIIPGTDDTHTLYIGTASYTWDNIQIQAATLARIVGETVDIDSTAATTITAATTMGIGGTIITLTGSTSVNLATSDFISNTALNFTPSTTSNKALVMGTSSLKWSTVDLLTSGAITINSGAGIKFIDGGSAALYMQYAAGTNPSLIFGGDDINLIPDTDDTRICNIGFTSYKWEKIILKAVDYVQIDAALSMPERGTDPAKPANGNCIIWMSDGTGLGDDGDVICGITDGGGTSKYTIFANFSDIAAWP